MNILSKWQYYPQHTKGSLILPDSMDHCEDMPLCWLQTPDYPLRIIKMRNNWNTRRIVYTIEIISPADILIHDIFTISNRKFQDEYPIERSANFYDSLHPDPFILHHNMIKEDTPWPDTDIKIMESMSMNGLIMIFLI